MQLIAEASYMCRELGGMSASDVGSLFRRLNDGPLAGFLMETTAAVYDKQDPEVAGKALVRPRASNRALLAPRVVSCAAVAARVLVVQVDAVLDSCGSKGTGKWTIQQAAELGVPCSTHAAALEARYLSSLKDQRSAAATRFPMAGGKAKRALPESWQKDLEDALLASKLCSYAQGMAHLKAVSDDQAWGLRLAELAAIWCARARLDIAARAVRAWMPTHLHMPWMPRAGKAVASFERRCSGLSRRPSPRIPPYPIYCSTRTWQPRWPPACQDGGASSCWRWSTASRCPRSVRRSPTLIRSAHRCSDRRNASKPSVTASVGMVTSGSTSRARIRASGENRDVSSKGPQLCSLRSVRMPCCSFAWRHRCLPQVSRCRRRAVQVSCSVLHASPGTCVDPLMSRRWTFDGTGCAGQAGEQCDL